ncbi:hypothetical protein [Curtobacterium sp. VKM Ac-2922]|uniref:hypothetical protein n=1 Tax=Curtobacterium sp. VKM Ac-2922 TaxID=2929475 RepID=UPI001FB2100F|nr:hypothetical protein [Curtobacterium sp. VKM Ac-2922]MCJ1712891.1 hypothetical protein [Curtobacterium sp. VKM Ac-2922]
MAARAAIEHARAERLAAECRAHRPLLEELATVGLEVESVWDLLSLSEPCPAALPILIEHLEHATYPSRVMEGIGRSLAVKPAVQYWDRLIACYRHATDDGAREGAAVALDACVTKQQIGDLITLTRDRHPSDELPIYFLQRIMRLGGDEGRSFVASLVDDPVLGGEATALTRRATKKAGGQRHQEAAFDPQRP